MKDLLHKIHQKPEHHKKNIALSVSFAITLMIFGVWLSALPTKFNAIGGVAKVNQEKLEKEITPLATVRASFDELKNTISELSGSSKTKEVMLETVITQ